MKIQSKRKRGRKLKLTKRLRIPKINHEEYLKEQGFKNIVGIDEVGRGSWAGPLVAAAVKLSNKRLYKIRDSKLLQPKEREKLSRKIKESAKFGIGQVEASEINKIGLSQALKKAYQLAIKDIKIKPDFILIDGLRIKDLKIPQKAIVKGDMLVASIAAASIIAKVYRDKLMRKHSRKYWQYKFNKNKGYGTRDHQNALKKYGICDIHRNYRPIKKIKGMI